MGFLEKNKKVLLKHYPGLWEELSFGDDTLNSDEIKIETTPSGEYTLNIKGLHIHSPRDPLREALRFTEAAGNEGGPVVILGFGLGFTAEAAAAFGRPIIIVEKYKCLLLKALELRDFSGFLSGNRLLFIVGGTGEGIMSALGIASDIIQADDAIKKKPSVIKNKALMSLDEQWYKPIEEKIHTWTMKDKVNAATLKRFGSRWARNLSRNISAIRDYPGVSRLAGLAAGNLTNEHNAEDKCLPVFLAAAGPGLDKIKPLLRDIYDRCIIVAVDTSLRFFVKNGIQPDFVFVVDPQFWNSRHLDRCVCGKIGGYTGGKTGGFTALIAEAVVYPPVLNLPFKHKFLCGSMFPPGASMEKQVDTKGRLGAGGSVATSAWDFARSLGAKEIWIAGLDLAFPGYKTHFRGARFEDISNSQSNRFNPVEKWVTRALRDGFPFKALSGNGKQVLTDQRLSLYAAWFENQFRLNPGVKNYCLNYDGLFIAGLQINSVENFLALPNRREEIDKRIQDAFTRIDVEFNSCEAKWERTKRYDAAVVGLEGEIKSFFNGSD